MASSLRPDKQLQQQQQQQQQLKDAKTEGNNGLPLSARKILCCRKIVEALAEMSAPTTAHVAGLRLRMAKQYELTAQPRLVDLVAALPKDAPDVRKRLLPLLLTKPVRTASGVAVVAVMSKPHRCPHIAMTGNVCVYCPGGPDSDFEYSSQSYTGYEPTSMRAIRARYDPYEQAKGRLDQLRALGHPCDKVEYIVMGGTFMSLPESYRAWFIARLHDAVSGRAPSLATTPHAGYDHEADLAASVRLSEQSASSRCVGITIETRPDYCLRQHLSQMLRYGCTRLEIGVQSVYEDVARDTNRGHTVRAACESFALAKDAGFKVVAHMMPDLPNVGHERDVAQFHEYFENPAFRSDGLKIYPTLVIRGTGLYELWRTGRYKSYTPADLVDLVARILALVPPWTRVYRVQRDIPMPLVSSGVKHGHLRQLADERLRELGTWCRDVRSREAGIAAIAAAAVEEAALGGHPARRNARPKKAQRKLDCAFASCEANSTFAANAASHAGSNVYRPGLDGARLELVRRDYAASGGWETFLSYEDPEADLLVGLLRLRRCSRGATYRPELLGAHAYEEGDRAPQSIVRELHVYGSVVPLSARDPTKFQHQGLGRLLMEEAERIAREEHGSTKLAVIAGVGTRNYYRRLGYTNDGPYMSKQLAAFAQDCC